MSALAKELALYELVTTKIKAPYVDAIKAMVWAEWDEAKREVELAVEKELSGPDEWDAVKKIAHKALLDSKHYDGLIEDATDRGFPIPKTFEAIETLVAAIYQGCKEGKKPNHDELRWKLGIGPKPFVRRA